MSELGLEDYADVVVDDEVIGLSPADAVVVEVLEPALVVDAGEEGVKLGADAFLIAQAPRFRSLPALQLRYPLRSTREQFRPPQVLDLATRHGL